jgi:hypothetical protein
MYFQSFKIHVYSYNVSGNLLTEDLARSQTNKQKNLINLAQV